MRDLLTFDDAGAGDDHPARGVTVGDIRAWHDDRERLRAAAKRVCWFDWSGNDPDASAAIDDLRRVIEAG